MDRGRYDWGKPYQPFKKKVLDIELVKELALINLMGIIANEKDYYEEYKALQDIYKNIRS